MIKKTVYLKVLILITLFFYSPDFVCGEMVLSKGDALKNTFHFCADAESFAVNPTDFSRMTDLYGEGPAFGKVLGALGRPILRLASMQRWDWRGEIQTTALVTSSYNKTPKTKLDYPYFTAEQYYEFAKSYGIKTVPMLDVRFFYNEDKKSVEITSENFAEASTQYAAGYARFIKEHKYDILFWEIGNEEYYTASWLPPKEYAKVAKAFIDAISKVSPEAKFGIQLSIWSGDWRSWSEIMLRELKGYEKKIDYAAVHIYNPLQFASQRIDEIMIFLRERGFFNTKLAVTEWRHTSDPDEYDRTFKSASAYSRYTLFMLRQRGIGVSCVHALPLFGGLAEWSDGKNWTAYSEELETIGIPDVLKTPRWRVLPFGLAQKMIIDAAKGRMLTEYSENPSSVSVYLFGGAGHSIILINESPVESVDSIKLYNGPEISEISGNELFSTDVDAKPSDIEPQPWSIRPLYIGSLNSSSKGSSAVAISGTTISFRLRPYTVVKIDIN